MEKKRNMDQSFDWKKKNGVASEGSALVKTSSTPAYAAGRDSLPTTTPYAPGLQAGVSSQPKPEKTEQAREPEQVREPEIPKGNETPPYVMGRDEAKPPTLPYGAGLQGGIKPQPPEQKPPNQSGGTEEEPYVMDRDEWEPPTIPYAPGLQAGFEPKGPGKKEEKPEPKPEKQVPQRTAKAVLEELNSLEQNYDDMLREAEAWESQAASQKTPEEISRWEKKGRELRQKAAELEPYLDTLQKEWKYAMDWEWEEKKKKDGYRDPTLRDLTVGSFQQGYDTSALGRESFRNMWGEEDNRKAELEEKLAGEEYKFIPEEWWEKVLSDVSFRIGGEAFKATSPETLVSIGGTVGTAALMGQAGPLAAIPEELVTVPGAAIAGYKVGSTATNIEIQAGQAYDAMLKNGVSKETARDIAMIIGGVDGAIDIIPINSALKYLKILDDSGASKEAIKFFLNKVEKMGVDTRTIIEAALKAEAQEEISKAGVGIGIILEGKRTPGPGKAKNNDAALGRENPWISDHTARKLLEDQRMLDYLKRKGDLRLEKNMSLDQKILAVKEATAAVISGQKKYPSDSGVKKRSKDRAKEA